MCRLQSLWFEIGPIVRIVRIMRVMRGGEGRVQVCVCVCRIAFCHNLKLVNAFC